MFARSHHKLIKAGTGLNCTKAQNYTKTILHQGSILHELYFCTRLFCFLWFVTVPSLKKGLVSFENTLIIRSITKETKILLNNRFILKTCLKTFPINFTVHYTLSTRSLKCFIKF